MDDDISQPIAIELAFRKSTAPSPDPDDEDVDDLSHFVHNLRMPSVNIPPPGPSTIIDLIVH